MSLSTFDLPEVPSLDPGTHVSLFNSNFTLVENPVLIKESVQSLENLKGEFFPSLIFLSILCTLINFIVMIFTFRIY